MPYLRLEVSESVKINKQVGTLETFIAKANRKKGKLNKDGEPSGAVDTSAELARQVKQWKVLYSSENVTLKAEIETLKAKYQSEVENHAKTTAFSGDEKAAKKDLERNIAHLKELNTAKVKHLEERIQEFKDDKTQYMSRVLGAPHASQSLRNSVQNSRLNSQKNTPIIARNDQPRAFAILFTSGSAQSP